MVTHNGLLHTIDYSLKEISIYIPPGVTLSALLPPGTSAGARETHKKAAWSIKDLFFPLSLLISAASWVWVKGRATNHPQVQG